MSTTVTDAFRRGDLAGAIAAAQAAVKAAPLDQSARWLLAELLLFAGEAERADRILDAVALDRPFPALLEFRRLLRAEVIRGQVWHEGRAPKFQGGDATPAQRAALRALVSARMNDPEGAAAAAAEAEELRPRAPGRCETADGSSFAFEDFRDADDLMAPNLEVLTTAGDHLLVPVERVRELRFDAPKRPRDLAWRRCAIELKDGTEGVVYMPAIYPWRGEEVPVEAKLGRVTTWSEGPGPVRGAGQRVFLAGERDPALGEIAALRFA
ncbi:MAG: tetratricopeptide repeat protein [Acetobacteraceae bacterium]|nr:tetratricopeptide repeat protein [Acetobacteraceae bacterium]